MFQEYIFSRLPLLSDLTHKSLSETGLLHEGLPSLKRTQFDDIYDTLLYSRLIEKALQMNPEVKTIVDLGSGSSIPTLLAMKTSGRDDLNTIAVDIDPNAHEIGSENARSLGLIKSFVFYKEAMEEALEILAPYGSQTLIVSNPPYVAAPEHLNEYFFMPVNGGIYGDDYLMKILRRSYESGTNLAFLWGSLTSPQELLPLLEENFEVLHHEAHRIHFGNYTKSEPLRSYLYRMRDQGLIYFEDTIDEGEVQFVFGTIIKKK
jgi:hypothetical protein